MLFPTYLIEERILLETLQQIGEIASDFLVNFSNQTDLVERSVPHRSVGIIFHDLENRKFLCASLIIND